MKTGWSLHREGREAAARGDHLKSARLHLEAGDWWIRVCIISLVVTLVLVIIGAFL